jgi:quercetin dioxygenase-like cupin family protein
LAVEIRRFGVGHRRSEGPAGTRGVEGQAIHADERGVISELAFRPRATMAPHSNPNLTYFLVLEGGGFVQVGEERARVAAGEAVVWPPDVVHAAWTEETTMRALAVEFPAVEPPAGSGVETAAQGVNGAARGSPGPAGGRAVRLSPDDPAARTSPEQEPW